MSDAHNPDPVASPGDLDLTGDLVELARALVDIESVSGNEARITDTVERALRAVPHLSVERIDNQLVARTQWGRPERVVLAGHLDTVPIAERDGVRNLPCRIEGEVTPEGDRRRLIGRGTCDMKGGVAVFLNVIATLTRADRDLTLVLYDCEEIEETRNGLRHLAETRPDLLAGDLALLGEPTSGAVEGGCQGTLRVRITTTGTAAHSARSWMGHNAIHDAADVLARLQAYQPRQIPVEGLTYREGLNAVKIEGGIAGNVVPDRCVITINYRFAPDKTPDQALAHVQEVFAGYELELTDLGPAARPGLDRPLAQEFLAAVGGEAKPKYGWTDVARFSTLGVPAVNFGPGDALLAHKDDEECPAADLTRCRDALIDWLSPNPAGTGVSA